MLRPSPNRSAKKLYSETEESLDLACFPLVLSCRSPSRTEAGWSERDGLPNRPTLVGPGAEEDASLLEWSMTTSLLGETRPLPVPTLLVLLQHSVERGLRRGRMASVVSRSSAVSYRDTASITLVLSYETSGN